MPYALTRTVVRKSRSHHTSYANRRWRAACAAWLQQYPVCVLCACEGRFNQGLIDFHSKAQRNLIVDHITPHRGDESLFWCQDNWQTLCRMPCHDRIKGQHDRRGRTADAWWAWLREVMQQRGTGLHVEALQRWLPTHVWRRLLE